MDSYRFPVQLSDPLETTLIGTTIRTFLPAPYETVEIRVGDKFYRTESPFDYEVLSFNEANGTMLYTLPGMAGEVEWTYNLSIFAQDFAYGDIKIVERKIAYSKPAIKEELSREVWCF